jgi:hypothetical protein
VPQTIASSDYKLALIARVVDLHIRHNVLVDVRIDRVAIVRICQCMRRGLKYGQLIRSNTYKVIAPRYAPMRDSGMSPPVP